MNGKRRLTAILAVVLTVLTLASYVGAYFATGERTGNRRLFESRWQQIFFAPASKVESLIRADEPWHDDQFG
jgi:hypothetical protein